MMARWLRWPTTAIDRAGQIRIAFDDPAIVQIAVEHRGFRRVEMPAHGGVDAVGADEQIALRLARRPAGRIVEVGKDLVAALCEAGGRWPVTTRLSTQPRMNAASRISCSLPREIEICGHL